MKLMRIMLLMFFAAVAWAQQPAPAVLQGIVVRIDADDPLSNATVQLLTAQGANTGIVASVTDAAGKFIFPSVPPGTYRVVASRRGYVRAEYGQRRSGAPGLAITLGTGQQRTDVRILLTAGGKISGRITDRGKPAAGAAVIAWKASYDGRQRMLTEVLSGITDDRGEYEIIWLPPGQYYVAAYVADAINDLGYRANFGRLAPPGSGGSSGAAPQYLNPDGDKDSQSLYLEQLSPREVLKRPIGGGPENTMHAPMFFPNTLDSQAATPIDVRPGGEARAINIDSAAMPVRRIRGTLTGLSAPVLNARGGVISPRIELIHLASGKRTTAQSNQQNTFEFSRLFRGSYLVNATLGSLTGRAEVEIRDTDVDVAVSLAPGLQVSGKIQIEPPPQSTNAATGIRALNVALRPDPWLPGSSEYTIPRPPNNGLANVIGTGAQGVVQVDDAPGNLHASFRIPSTIPPGNYRVLVDPIMTYPSPPIPTGTPLQNDYLAIQNAYVKSIRLRDVDILNNSLHLQDQLEASIDIVIGTNPGALEARVVNKLQQPVAHATVVLIPESGQRFHTAHKLGLTDASGQAQIHGIAPGDYKLFAWEDIEQGAWQDPTFVRNHEPFGKSIYINEGEKAATEVSVIPFEP